MFENGSDPSGIEPGRSTETDEALGWDEAPTRVRVTLPEALAEQRPGPVLAKMLADVDRTQLNGYELVLLVKAEQRQATHYQARSFQTMAELAHCPPGYAGSPTERQPDIDEYAADELRPALGWTRRAADSAMDLALELVERFPLILKHMLRGRIDLPKARVTVNTLTHLEERHIKRVTEDIVDRADELTTGQLGARLRRASLAIDPESAHTRYKSGLKERYVTCRPNPDGTANLTAHNLGAITSNRIFDRVNRIALKVNTKNDARSIDQIRADVFCDLLTGGLSLSGENMEQDGVVDIQVSLTTLTQLDEQPGTIPGWGPVIAEIARKVADPHKKWRFTITDDNHRPIGGGLVRRRPEAELKREIETTVPNCLFPGCRMPSRQCDLDHNQPWSKGGPTTSRNMGPLCRHGHVVKDDGEWKLKRNPDGSYTWTSRHGHIYDVDPDDEPP